MVVFDIYQQWWLIWWKCNRLPNRIRDSDTFWWSLTSFPNTHGLNLLKRRQIVNGEEYTYEMMELNTGNGQKDMVGYHRFLDATGCLFRSEGNMVRLRIWGHGKNCTLFAFSKMANERHDDLIFLPRNEALINIHLKFAVQGSHHLCRVRRFDGSRWH